MLRDAIKHLREEEDPSPSPSPFSTSPSAGLTPALARIRHGAHRRTRSADVGAEEGQGRGRSKLAGSAVGEEGQQQHRGSHRGPSLAAGVSNNRGSIRSFFATEEEEQHQHHQSTRKRMLERLLRRGRGSTAAPIGDDEESDSDSEHGQRRPAALERTGSVVIHDSPAVRRAADAVEQGEQRPLAASRARVGAVVANPARALDALEERLTAASEEYERAHMTPLRELQAMVLECDESAAACDQPLAALKDAMDARHDHAVLRTYEAVAEDLVRDALPGKLRFSRADLLRLDESLRSMERIVARNTARAAGSTVWMYIAVILGVAIAVVAKRFGIIK